MRLAMHVTAKLGNMRKPQEFIVYPKRTDGLIMIQSDKAIALFDPATGKGLLNTKGCYQPHLLPGSGVQPYQFPQPFINECLEKFPAIGQHVGGGVYIGGETQVMP